MPYKRVYLLKPEKRHKVYDEWGQLDQLSDHEQGWIYPALIDMLDEARVSLSQFSTMVTQVTKTDWSELKPEVAKEKQTDT